MTHSCILLLALTAACGAPGRVEIPAASAPTCSAGDLDSEPLIVDLRADKRADLETASAHGIVAVTYDCGGVKVLPSCTAHGEYAFTGVSEKEQLVRLSKPIEIRANAPTNGASLVTDDQHDLHVAMAIVGTRTASRARLAPSDFEGSCSGATHFIRSMTVGAFGLAVVAHGKPATLESVFSSGDAHDGNAQACRSASPNADAPPASCASTLRVSVEPLGRAVTVAAERHCPRGTVPTDAGECRDPSAIAFHLCRPDDASECQTQCDKGSMGSCAILGRNYQLGRGVALDLSHAKQLLTRACDGASAQGCHRLGEILLLENKPTEARTLFEKSCSSGWLEGCESFGQLAMASPGVKVDVFSVFKRACAGGNFESCASLGKLYETGLGAPQDDAKAVKLYELACDSGVTRRACVSLSVMVERGRGTPADPKRAVEILDHACEHGSSDSCGMLSLHYFEGRGVDRDATRALTLLQRACEGDDRGSCLPLAMRYQAGIGVPKDVVRATQYFTRACDSGIAIACQQIQR